MYRKLFQNKSLLLLHVLAGMVTILFAQQPEITDEVIRVETNNVSVPFYVTDKRGRRVHDIAREELTLFEDGQPRKVEDLVSGARQVKLSFVLDASGSSRDFITRERDTALALFQRFGAGSDVTVFHIRETPFQASRITSNMEEAKRAFTFPPSKNVGSAIFDTALAAIRDLSVRSNNEAHRKILILISDGLDNRSSSRAADVIRAAQESLVSIYVIHFPLYTPAEGYLTQRRTARGFTSLSKETAGLYFLAFDAKAALDLNPAVNLNPIFEAIEQDLSSQYVLSFHPRRYERQLRRSLELKLAPRNRRDLRVNLLRKYYIF
jgi:Ca-activated chloride channel homolog